MSPELTVEGMSCAGCEETVENALEDVAGVADAEADSETDTVTVAGDAELAALVRAVEDAGYEAST